MDARKVKISLEVISEVSAKFNVAKKVTKERFEEIFLRENNSRKDIFCCCCFILLLIKVCVFGVMVCCLVALRNKNNCLLWNKGIC